MFIFKADFSQSTHTHAHRRALTATIVGMGLFALADLAAAQQPLIIDDFTSGDFKGGAADSPYGSWQTIANAYVETTYGNMLGGSRTTASTTSDGVSVANGILNYNTSIQYGSTQGYHAADAGAGSDGLDVGYSFYPLLNLSAYNAIDVTFPSLSSSLDLIAEIGTATGGPGAGYIDIIAPKSAGPTVISLPFTAFFGNNVPVTGVFSLSFGFLPASYNPLNPYPDMGAPMDFSVTSITAVPEPESYLLLLTGIFGLPLTRRAWQRKLGA